NAVIGLANLLAASKPLTSRQQEFIETLQLSADTLLSLINDLLDIAKIEAHTIDLEEVPFSVVKLAEEVVSIMTIKAKEKGLGFSYSTACECIHKRTFLGDPTRLRQIILNLCSNALKFTEIGGVEIEIKCEHSKDSPQELVSITVKDTGIGIAEEKLASIFDKFVQADSSINRKYGGTGLGLAITKTLTEIMGGSIHAESTPGKGSSFTVNVPLKRNDNELPTPGASAENRRDNIPNTRPRVLLVEDYAANILVATTFLDEFGYDCDVANNGIEALEKIKHNHYLLVLMDVQMHGMNGLEASSHIRKYEKERGLEPLPIIGMTAHALAGDRERCLAAGMDDYLAKPFNPDELQQKISRYAAPQEQRVTEPA
ncbi:MAG: response regulator, partial [Proteobacteria bacterium]|nr:response regulator [Pseudomonadota bacterium]